MLFWTIIKVAFKSLFANKLRTFLAMLGIIIGVGAVISMLAMGTGAQERVMERIASMGTYLMVVRPGQRGLRGRMLDISQRLRLADAKAILDQVPGVYQAAPVVRGNSQLKYFNKIYDQSLTSWQAFFLRIADNIFCWNSLFLVIHMKSGRHPHTEYVH